MKVGTIEGFWLWKVGFSREESSEGREAGRLPVGEVTSLLYQGQAASNRHEKKAVCFLPKPGGGTVSGHHRPGGPGALCVGVGGTRSHAVPSGKGCRVSQMARQGRQLVFFKYRVLVLCY